jgi:superfamily II DNA/RNA helicase
VFFSATFTDEVITTINKFIQSYEKFQIPKEALKLKGVKQYRILVSKKKKYDLIKDLYELTEQT